MMREGSLFMVPPILLPDRIYDLRHKQFTEITIHHDDDTFTVLDKTEHERSKSSMPARMKKFARTSLTFQENSQACFRTIIGRDFRFKHFMDANAIEHFAMGMT